MDMCRFDVVQATSLEQACQNLNDLGDQAQVIAGGTDLLRDIRVGAKRPSVLVSLDRVDNLNDIQENPNQSISIGALSTMAQLASQPLLQNRLQALYEAAAWMGSPQVRNRATIGGNLVNARPCADSAPPSMVCDGTLVLKSQQGTREVPVDGFMTSPGATIKKPNEILQTIRFPKLPTYSGSAFVTVTNRKAVEITITSAAARISLQSPQGPMVEVKIALGSVGPIPLRAVTAEAELKGQIPTDSVLSKAAQAAVLDCHPIDDLRGSTLYRKWMVEVLTRRALQTALARAQTSSEDVS